MGMGFCTPRLTDRRPIISVSSHISRDHVTDMLFFFLSSQPHIYTSQSVSSVYAHALTFLNPSLLSSTYMAQDMLKLLRKGTWPVSRELCKSSGRAKMRQRQIVYQ